MLIESMNTLMLALKADQIDALVTADIVCKQAMAANPNSPSPRLWSLTLIS